MSDEVVNPTIREVISEVLREHDQPRAFENQFVQYFENLARGNLGKHDLEDLIESVGLEES